MPVPCALQPARLTAWCVRLQCSCSYVGMAMLHEGIEELQLSISYMGPHMLSCIVQLSDISSHADEASPMAQSLVDMLGGQFALLDASGADHGRGVPASGPEMTLHLAEDDEEQGPAGVMPKNLKPDSILGMQACTLLSPSACSAKLASPSASM